MEELFVTYLRERLPLVEEHRRVEQRRLEAVAPVGVGHVVGAVAAEQRNLRPERVEGRLDEGRGVEQLLALFDHRTQEFLAVAQTAEPRGGDDGVDLRGVDPAAAQRGHRRGYAHAQEAAHASPHGCRGDQLGEGGQLLVVERMPVYVAAALHGSRQRRSEAQLPPNPNEFDSTQRRSLRVRQSSGRMPPSGSGSAKRSVG